MSQILQHSKDRLAMPKNILASTVQTSAKHMWELQGFLKHGKQLKTLEEPPINTSYLDLLENPDQLRTTDSQLA